MRESKPISMRLALRELGWMTLVFFTSSVNFEIILPDAPWWGRLIGAFVWLWSLGVYREKVTEIRNLVDAE